MAPPLLLLGKTRWGPEPTAEQAEEGAETFIPNECRVELRCLWRHREPGILPSDSSSDTHHPSCQWGPLGELECRLRPAGKTSPPTQVVAGASRESALPPVLLPAVELEQIF